MLKRLGVNSSQPQSFSLLDPQHQIQVLDGLPGCPFAEIVESGNKHYLTAVIIGIDPYLHHVAAVYPFSAGEYPRWKYIHEELIPVLVLQYLPDSTWGNSLFQLRITGA